MVNTDWRISEIRLVINRKDLPKVEDHLSKYLEEKGDYSTNVTGVKLVDLIVNEFDHQIKEVKDPENFDIMLSKENAIVKMFEGKHSHVYLTDAQIIVCIFRHTRENPDRTKIVDVLEIASDITEEFTLMWYENGEYFHEDYCEKLEVWNFKNGKKTLVDIVNPFSLVKTNKIP